MEEREIDLIDMLVEVLLRWRMILVWMLIFGVLAGGLSYVTSFLDLRKQDVQQQNVDALRQDGVNASYLLKSIEKELTTSQILNIEAYINRDRNYAMRREYFENSSLMHVDPKHVPQIDIVIGIMGEDNETASSIAVTYGELINNMKRNTWITDRLGRKNPSDIEELIQCTASASYMYQPLSRTIRVTVRERNESFCRDLAQAVMEYIDNIDLTDMYGKYELTEISNFYSEVIDYSLYDRQKEVRDELLSMKTEIISTRKSLSKSEQQYYNLLYGKEFGVLPSDEELDENDESSLAKSPGISIKITLLGLILGAFLYMGCAALLYIVSNKLRFGDDMAKLYRIPVLGQIPDLTQSKKLFGFIDKWLCSFRNRDRRHFSAEEAMRLSAVAVKMEAEKGQFPTIYCVGCKMQGKAATVYNTLKETLEKNNITVKILDNILYDAEEREQLRDAKAAVLLEKAGDSIYTEIAEELELLKRQDVKVLGGIIVE